MRTRWVVGVIAVLLALAGLSGPALAQGPQQLVLGEPVVVTLSAEAATASLGYSVAEGRAVTLLAISESVPPALAILHDGAPVAALDNAEGAMSVTLDAYLPAGEYTVEVGGVGGATGDVVVLVQAETPVPATPLAPGSPVQGTLGTGAPFAVYTFTALGEPAYLYADSLVPEVGLRLRLLNVTAGAVSAELGAELTGARLTIPAGAAEYQIELTYGEPGADQPFSLCFSAASADTCGGSAGMLPPTDAPLTPAAVCVVTSSSGGSVNVRQTTALDSMVVTVLPGGTPADVLGVSPDGLWFQVSYGGMTGWASASILAPSGACASVPVVNPPALPAAPPAPTNPPAPPMPTTAPTVPPTAVPSGPCLVTFTAGELYYTQPTAEADYIFDQIMAGGELILVARWDSNPSWYKTSSGMWWPNAVGTAGILSGGCASLPSVSWP